MVLVVDVFTVLVVVVVVVMILSPVFRTYFSQAIKLDYRLL
jgi:hypothetical protein